MRRELAIALRSRVTWFVAALTALLVGHGFVLAVDLFSSSSRSALASVLQAREMDPLLGVVRPTFGGFDLSVTLFAPIVAARVLSVEKERGTFGALCLLEGSIAAVVTKKLVAALAATSLSIVPPVVLLAAYRIEGGRLDAIETVLALGGALLHVLFVSVVSVAAAAWTRTVPQAATVGVALSISSWAIDAADGFAALSWLGGAAAWSVDHHLEPFQQGIVSIGSLSWLLVASACAVMLAFLGARFDLSPARRAVGVLAALVLATAGMSVASRSHRAYDWSEDRRFSLSPPVVRALRDVPERISIDVYLDRDDSRRRQLETDVLAKLFLARPDLEVRAPYDERPSTPGQRDDDYGRIVVRVGASSKETRSTSRREITTLIFETAHRPTPSWEMPAYEGHPRVVEGSQRAALGVFAYGLLPSAFLGLGALFTRRRLSR